MKINYIRKYTTIALVAFVVSMGLDWLVSPGKTISFPWAYVVNLACIDSLLIVLALLQTEKAFYPILKLKQSLKRWGIRRVLALLIILIVLFNQYYQYRLFVGNPLSWGTTPEIVLHWSLIAIIGLFAISTGLLFNNAGGPWERLGVVIGFVLLGGGLSLLSWLLNFNIFFYYFIGAFVILNLLYFIGRIRFNNYPLRGKGANLANVMPQFFGALFRSYSVVNGIIGFTVILCIALNIVLLSFQHLPWWKLAGEIVLYFIVDVTILAVLQRFYLANLLNRAISHITTQIPVDHKNYEIVYAVFLDYKYPAGAKDPYEYLKNHLPTPTFINKAVLDMKPVPEAPIKQAAPAPPKPIPPPRKVAPAAASSVQANQTKRPGEKSNIIKLIYEKEIDHIAAELKWGLSVLIKCDKIITSYVWSALVEAGNAKYDLLEIPDPESVDISLVKSQMEALRGKVKNQDSILIIPHLDLLAGGPNSYPTDVAREIIQLLYYNNDRAILAFTDVTFEIPEVLASRFSITKSLEGVPKTISKNGSTISVASLMITEGQMSYINDFNPEDLYRSISGMNPIKISQAINYAISDRPPGKNSISMEQLKDAIRAFKAKTSNNFAVPDITLDDIGGYRDVKNELLEAIQLIKGTNSQISESLRDELIPKGFLFYGPPGTGKTLFAKAVANQLMANVMVVSGPEILNLYIGESERRIREIFAEARRNAPSVLVFDEFDSIASNRTGSESGGTKLYNGVVAQILTEMDGFRPDVPVLVIGTTNRLDIIDPALLRPSRFKPINIDLPDMEACKEIIKIYARNFQISLSNQLSDALAENIKNSFNGDEIKSIFRQMAIARAGQNIPDESVPRHLGEIVGRMRYLKENQNASISRNPQFILLDRR